MPQVRDPKTGRYTSGGGSSYEAGASAGTNSRIQKAKAVGAGATSGKAGEDKYQQALKKIEMTQPGSMEYWDAVRAAEKVYSKSGKPTNGGVQVGDRVEYMGRSGDLGLTGTVTKVISPTTFEYKIDADVVKANKGLRINGHRSLGAAQFADEAIDKGLFRKIVSGK